MDPLKPILASGYTDRDRAELVPFVTWWTLFLSEAGIDVLVFQDGAGLPRQAPWQAIASWIGVLCTVADETGGDIWLVGETFTQVHGPPIDSDGFQAQPADFARVRQQLELLGEYKRRLLAYSYFDYMRPAADDAAAALFEAYVDLVDKRAATRRASADTPPPSATAGNEP